LTPTNLRNENWPVFQEQQRTTTNNNEQQRTTKNNKKNKRETTATNTAKHEQYWSPTYIARSDASTIFFAKRHPFAPFFLLPLHHHTTVWGTFVPATAART